ncbi:hypothetical protein M948_07895 [Virgibacillus sp. CM-4]|nr:hypothetical protein M948_07895 [Virgibacillus sp. CM-4]
MNGKTSILKVLVLVYSKHHPVQPENNGRINDLLDTIKNVDNEYV